MRIVFLSRLHYPHLGGVEKFMENITSQLSIKHDVTVITEQYDKNLKLLEIYRGIKIIRIPTYFSTEKQKKWVIWHWLYKNIDILRNSDIIHVNDVFFWILPWRLIKHFNQTFITFYGWETKFPIPYKNIMIRKISEKLARGNICIGDFIAKWYHTTPNIISYGAVNKAKYRSRNTNTLLFTGRLDKDTGFEDCVKLYNTLKNKLGWSFIIAGDGPLSRIVPQDTKFLGFVSEPEKYIAYARYVFTTGYLGILEAFSYKKIVLGTYNNPLKKDYLLLHPQAKNMLISNSYKSLADLLSSKSNADLDDMRINSNNWSKQHTWVNHVKLYEQLWGLR
ncbi:hypothetical protein A2379_01155 [Candidatus Amesbacteria bacterium RIFOXYB1_FULL_47_13]|nr:MAG: Glycosyltransferase, group 1 family protein [Candidatus Amesbacteria bacterium GW2011_GWA1_44_24]KKU30929.1 MAG: glycosyl transferase, group 1 family protein [Candidatus Amesbacteria bacterium GW2011_GWC1_46_24]OGD05314.1 MAG: hypothetical protein A2379_01155 [Candidatus Amesbacteria bacterium RIFOXYB1_FULL_47_13]HBC73232.1 hypothetical protein [Candidatus Amesbacteria bacterium]